MCVVGTVSAFHSILSSLVIHMKKKPLAPVLKERYTALEKSEANLRRDLKTVYAANAASIAEIVAVLYQDCTKGDKIRYANLFTSISKQQAAKLEQQTEHYRRVYGDYCAADFPFTVSKFDRLNRLDAAKAELILNELEAGDRTNDLLMSMLRYHVVATMAATAAAIAVKYSATDEAIESVVRNKQYPILKSLYEQHRAAGEREATLLKESLTRGEQPEKAAKSLTEYAEKRAKNSTDKLMYTEDTRATVEAVADVVKDYMPYFATVTVGDGKVCDHCEQIAAAQAADPVPFSAFQTGVTAPPFHPWCRCGIEGIYLKQGEPT